MQESSPARRECLPPKEPGRLSRALPRGSCDTHVHVIGRPDRYPMSESRSYDAPEATGAKLLGMLDAVGVDYGVVVQISLHGTDNSLLVETLKAHPDRLKGVAVIAADTAQRELDALAEAGVVAIRLQNVTGGGIDVDELDRMADICKAMGWHIQFMCSLDTYATLSPRLVDLPVPFVIDHMGWSPSIRGFSQPLLDQMSYFLRNADCWLKMSNGFRMSQQSAPWSDVVPYIRALVDTNPDRLLWASDWPHILVYDDAGMPSVSQLIDFMRDSIGSEENVQKIFVENPRILHGF